jgi:hypothetical protein
MMPSNRTSSGSQPFRFRLADLYPTQIFVADQPRGR